jgi:plastocyanin
MSRWSKLALVALVGAGSLVPTSSATAGGFCAGYEGEKPTAQRGRLVRMIDNCFAPTVLFVDRGTTVRFVNGDAANHTVGGAAGSFGDMHAPIGPNASTSHTFEEVGVYPYVCLLHPGMAGAVFVGGDGAEAALDAAGSGAPIAGDTGDGTAAGPRTGDATTGAEGSGPAAASAATGTIAVAFLVVLAGALVALSLTARRRAAAPAEHEA